MSDVYMFGTPLSEIMGIHRKAICTEFNTMHPYETEVDIDFLNIKKWYVPGQDKWYKACHLAGRIPFL